MILEFSQLPALNATLNGTSAVLLTCGYVSIRTGRRRAHAAFMLSAVVVSLIFLVSYVYYHAYHGRTHFAYGGMVRYVYFSILLSHTILAIVTALWLVPVTLSRALRARFQQHRALARWTLPIWFYVSVTGVVIYFMLYHWYANP